MDGMPPTIFGSGSELAVTWVVVGSIFSAERTTTLPRSNGPAWAGTSNTRLYGAPLYGPAR